ncbi:MAG: hypothetical protein WBC44_00070 [Planctomycetaceae bacterium]
MAWRNMLLWLAVVVVALLVGGGLLYAPILEVSRFVFAPIGVAGFFGAYLLGVRQSSSESLRSRMTHGSLLALTWTVFLLLPWGMGEAAYRWERISPIRPPDGVPFGPGLLETVDGFQFGITSDRPWPEIERHYTEQLSRRGWRHEWSRDFRKSPQGAPPGVPLPRWILYRRFDGLMLICIGTLPDGRTSVVSDYMHLERWFEADHLLRK